jgi:two-component system sensor histidine kinase YesM
VHLEVQKEALSLHTLKLILQPLLENAIKHGIQEKQPRHGTIDISISVEQDALCFVVRDDGVGFDVEAWENRKPHQIDDPFDALHTSGYGLSSLENRLRLFYGDRYTLRIESDQGVGTSITIRQPIQ